MPNPNYYPAFGTGGLFKVASGTGTAADPYVPEIDISAGGYVTNPMTADLNAAGYAVTNVGTLGSALTWIGTWDSGTAYVVNDVVFDINILGPSQWAYVCVINHTNHEPPNATYWKLLLNGNASYYGAGPYDSPGNITIDTVRLTVFTENTNAAGASGDVFSSDGTTQCNSCDSWSFGDVIDSDNSHADSFGQVAGLSPTLRSNHSHANSQGHVTYGDSCFAAAGGSVTGTLGHQPSNCFAIGNISGGSTNCSAIGGTINGDNTSCIAIGGTISGGITAGVTIGGTVTANSAFAIGFGITNSTASTIQIGYADATKISIDTNGLRGLNSIVYATGTAYTLTGTAAAIVFGTTSPSLTLTNAAKYRLRSQLQVELVGATFAANQTLTIKLRRSNNTAADIASSTVTLTLPIVTTATQTLYIVSLPDIFYTATAGDIVTIFAGLSATPAAGSVQISAANISQSNVY